MWNFTSFIQHTPTIWAFNTCIDFIILLEHIQKSLIQNMIHQGAPRVNIKLHQDRVVILHEVCGICCAIGIKIHIAKRNSEEIITILLILLLALVVCKKSIWHFILVKFWNLILIHYDRESIFIFSIISIGLEVIFDNCTGVFPI